MNVLVMGMHRSGTSALAGALRAAGLYAGEEALLMAARAENPTGFAELVPVIDFNDRLLDALGWTWDAPPPTPLADPPPVGGLVEEGRRLVDEMVGQRAPWVLKDPRLSLLLPWWRQILLDRFVAVVSVRPAREVARSLSVRNGFPIELGLALYAAYYRHLAVGLAGMPVVVVDYSALTGTPRETITEFLPRLGELGVEWQPDAEAAAAHVRPDLRNSTQPNADGRAGTEPIPDSVAAVERAWSLGAVAAQQRFSLPVGPAERWETALLNVHRHGRMAQRAAEAASRAEAERLHGLYSASEDEKRELQAHLARLDAEIDEQRLAAAATAADFDTRIAAAHAQLAAYEDQIGERDARLAELDAQISERDARLAALEAERRRLLHRLARRAYLLAGRLRRA